MEEQRVLDAHDVVKILGNFRQNLISTLVFEVAPTPRDLILSGYPKYGRDELRPYFGYDQWVGWMAIPEIMWMHFLDIIGFAPGIAQYLDLDWAKRTLTSMRTRDMDTLERKPEIGHDVNAMLFMLRKELPIQLHRYAHFGWTSYDCIEQARALMFLKAHYHVLKPAMDRVDELMRRRIHEFTQKIQMHRTHLQYALPATVGFWLSVIHRHFVESARHANQAVEKLTGKVSGATGVGSALNAFEIPQCFARTVLNAGESMESFFLTKVMGLGKPSLSTQIIDARLWSRYLTEMYFVSSVLGQLGEDSRILQSSGIGEVLSISSTSSTMAHKDSNPVAAEGMVGMYRMNTAEVLKPFLNMISDLGRDLCNSRPSRDYQTLIIYLYEQLRVAERLLSQMQCNDEMLARNFGESKFLVMSELLFLALSKAGLSEAHRFVNKEVMPEAKRRRSTLVVVMDDMAQTNSEVAAVWEMVPSTIKNLLVKPEEYLGDAVEICMVEDENSL
ncbi:MAG: lyase family protein [Patescibacteria group bacterium]